MKNTWVHSFIALIVSFNQLLSVYHVSNTLLGSVYLVMNETEPLPSWHKVWWIWFAQKTVPKDYWLETECIASDSFSPQQGQRELPVFDEDITVDFVTRRLFRDLSFHLLKSKLILWDMNQVIYPFCDQLCSDLAIYHILTEKMWREQSDVIKIPGHVKMPQVIPGSRRACLVGIPLHNHWN